jgi:hypothetical protein
MSASRRTALIAGLWIQAVSDPPGRSALRPATAIIGGQLVAPARAWAAVTSRALERHASREAARALTVLLDGALIQALVGGAAMPRQEPARILRAVLTALP